MASKKSTSKKTASKKASASAGAKKKAAAKTAPKAAKPAAPTAGLVEPGSPAPAFDLVDRDQKSHRLRDYRGQWIILYFYPKDDTSGCTKQACGFRDAIDELASLDAVVLGVSPDSAASHARFADKYELPFTLLADPDHEALAAYGVWQQKSMYGRTYMGVVRTTYLIDPKGRVAARWDKVKVPGHVDEVREKLQVLAADG